MEEKQTFEYNYVAPSPRERREIESIRRKYAPEKEEVSPLSRLKALDKKVGGTAQALALTVGVVGTLIFGLGFSMVLEFGSIVWGVIVAFLGVIVLLAAYPAYLKILARGKKKYGDEILRLTEALLGEKGVSPAAESPAAEVPATESDAEMKDGEE